MVIKKNLKSVGHFVHLFQSNPGYSEKKEKNCMYLLHFSYTQYFPNANFINTIFLRNWKKGEKCQSKEKVCCAFPLDPGH